jgi:hypothetical protein
MKINNSCISKNRNYLGFIGEVYQKYIFSELGVCLVKKVENTENCIVYFCTKIFPYK